MSITKRAGRAGRAGRARRRAAVLVVWSLLAAGCGANGDDTLPAGQRAGTEPSGQDTLRAAPVVVEPTISAGELLARLQAEDAPLVLDVRSPEEYREGHVPGAINIPYDRIGATLDSLNSFKGREVVVYCRTGRRAGIAETALREAGFLEVRDLEGHMQGWVADRLPVDVPDADCC